MIDYFDKDINGSTVKELKKKGMYGDYIYARRINSCEFYITDISYYKHLKNFINLSLCWSDTPQGSYFWNKMYGSL